MVPDRGRRLGGWHRPTGPAFVDSTRLMRGENEALLLRMEDYLGKRVMFDDEGHGRRRVGRRSAPFMRGISRPPSPGGSFTMLGGVDGQGRLDWPRRSPTLFRLDDEAMVIGMSNTWEALTRSRA